MAKKLYEESNIQAIADAIRVQNGGSDKYTTADMAGAILALSPGGIESEVYEWQQTPTAVKNFLDNVTYDPDDYTTSRIAEFAPATMVASNAVFAGVTVPVSGGQLDRDGYGITVQSGNATLYNDIPGAYTPFTVSNNGAVSSVGMLRPTGGFLRQIKCATAINVRDMGGWSCDGGTVKYGMLIRGGDPAANDRDVLVNQCGVRHELNLRSASEANRDYSILGDDIGYSIFEYYAWYSISNTELWRQMLRVVFDCVATNQPVYIHCAAGADRTGTIACILEAILGVSQSDIDKDYELTCFYSGTGTDAQARRRNETEWAGLISAISAKTGSTFRDKAVRFCLELGFTIDEINAFRAAMIDGTPTTLTASLSTYTVTNTLTHVTNNNDAQTATQYQPYQAEIKAEPGYVISDISVTMGGENITSQVFTGTKTILRRSVTYNLTGCSATLMKSSVVDGEMFFVDIVADHGYDLEGASVSITMGGINVSNYYSDGRISIPSVNGNIVITVSATAAAKENLLKMDNGLINMRIPTNGTPTTGSADGYFITDYFPFDYNENTGIRIVNGNTHMGSLSSSGAYGQCKFAIYDSGKNLICQWCIAHNGTNNTLSYFAVDGNDLVKSDIADENGTCITGGTIPSDWSTVKFIRLGLALNNAATVVYSVSDVLNSGLAIYAE